MVPTTTKDSRPAEPITAPCSAGGGLALIDELDSGGQTLFVGRGLGDNPDRLCHPPPATDDTTHVAIGGSSLQP